MEWRDEGIVLGLKRLGESSSVLEAMTRGHGRHLGLVRGARRGRLAAALQPGNTLGLVWRARLDEHLGAFAVEPLTLRAGRFLPSAVALAGLAIVGALLRLLPERDPHESLLRGVGRPDRGARRRRGAPASLARFEARMLGECGFALDLSECAATGATDGSRLRLAEIRPRGQRGARRALSRAPAAAARVPARGGRRARRAERSRRRFGSPGIFWSGNCSGRAAGNCRRRGRLWSAA